VLLMLEHWLLATRRSSSIAEAVAVDFIDLLIFGVVFAGCRSSSSDLGSGFYCGSG
jgi:hypothetical protein